MHPPLLVSEQLRTYLAAASTPWKWGDVIPRSYCCNMFACMVQTEVPGHPQTVFAYVSLLNQLFYVIAWRLLHLHGNTETAFAFLACSDFIHISRGVQDLVEFISDLQIFTYFVLCINRLKISEIIQVGEFNPPSSLNGLRLGRETYSSLLFSINLTDPFFTFTFTRTCRKYIFFCASSSLGHSCFQGHLPKDLVLNSLEGMQASHFMCA